MMRKKILGKDFLLLTLFFMTYPVATNAQIQQGYEASSDAPQVQVDRSVLGDLKGYEPPPMFANPSVENTPQTENIQAIPLTTPTTATTKVPAPEAPSLTVPDAPKAEDILNHPVENFHVLTERNPQLTQPESPAPSPAPHKQGEEKRASSPKGITTQPLPPRKPQQIAAPTTSAPRQQEQIAKPKKQAPTEDKIVTIPAKKIEPPAVIKPTTAYRPTSGKSMPAVPPIQVERAELAPPMQGTALPALPPTTDGKTEPRNPTIGERIMDASLLSHIESDEEKIKEKLTTTSKQAALKPTEPKPYPKDISDNSLVFTSDQTELTAEAKTRLEQKIIPNLSKNPQSRIQILSFAKASDGTESSSRRLSLSRALVVRDYLLARKIDAARIDVRALANQGSGTPADRVDIVLLK